VPRAADVRAVIDTNVLLSGLFWLGPPHRLIQQIRAGTLTLVSSPALLTELEDVLRRPKFQTVLARARIDLEGILNEARRLAEIVDAPAEGMSRSRDPDDNVVLAVAVASRADMIISGDADLLTLGSHAGIPIVDPAAAIDRIAGQEERAS
jgi:putative PIN family toxin of toxin-antitoxin system